MEIQRVHNLANSISIETDMGNFFMLGNGDIIDENEEKIDPELKNEISLNFMGFINQRELQNDKFHNPISHLRDAVDEDLYTKEVDRMRKAEDESLSRDFIEGFIKSNKFNDFLNQKKSKLGMDSSRGSFDAEKRQMVAIHYVYIGDLHSGQNTKKFIDTYKDNYSLNLQGVEERFVPSVTRSEIEFIVV